LAIEGDRPLRPVVLFGPMGSGKSTLAPLVAGQLGRPAIDLDSLIEARQGASISEIFASSGEAHFRNIERKILLETLARRDGPIVAAGGGALADRELRESVRERARVVTLTAPIPTLVGRLGTSANRPLLAGSDAAETLEKLVASRLEAYDDGPFSIDTSIASPESVARTIARLVVSGTETLIADGAARSWVHITDQPWDVLSNVLARARPSNVVVVTDNNVAEHYLAEAEGALTSHVSAGQAIVIAPGESSKRLSELEAVLERLAAFDADKKTVIVSLGGGVVSDLAGFAAAVYMRGIRWVAVATSTVAMVDAAIGGKTAVDLGARKNSVGAFHLPLATIIAPRFANTESPRAIRSGLAEALKTFAVSDARAFARMEETPDDSWLTGDVLGFAIEASARAKAVIVAADPRDHGKRAILNFGHTFGHAIESAGGFQDWTHGEAVALGIGVALRLGVQLGATPAALAARIASVFRRSGLPSSISRQALKASALLRADKKRAGEVLHFILLKELGEPLIVPIPLGDLERMAPTLATA